MRTLAWNANLAAPEASECLPVGKSVTIDGTRRTWGDSDCSRQLNIFDSINLLRLLGGLGYTAADPTCPHPGSGIWLPTPTPEPTSSLEPSPTPTATAEIPATP